ncbi:acyl carrier protein [Pumilibacter intestinalis]|jgi:acyl carrier protein|uniref:acyl carrier protein n=1 Tax=Pumilibacter intestinalis TaxID=2941511 RepID=UPI00203B1DF3|nr:acyl carrier protein [Pumilibacter intestinalis]MCI8487405.1 acyl carrier protein [Clostridia bacterium]
MFDKVTEMLAKYLKVDKSVITRDTDVRADLNADSLLVVEMLFTLEEETGVTIPDEKVEELTRVGALVDYIESEMKK